MKSSLLWWLASVSQEVITCTCVQKDLVRVTESIVIQIYSIKNKSVHSYSQQLLDL